MMRKKIKKDKKRTILKPQHKYLLLMASGLLCLALLINYLLLQRLVVPANQQRFEEQVKINIENHKQQIKQYLSQLQQPLNEITSSIPIDIFTRDRAELALWQSQQQSDWLTNIPSAKAITLYAQGDAQRQQDEGAPISFIVLDMINRLEADKPTYIEVAKASGNVFQLHKTMPIRDNSGNIIGVVHAILSLQGLNDIFAKTDSQLAKIDIQQRLPRQSPLSFYSYGQRSNIYPQRIIDIPGSYWQISYAPSETLFSQTKIIPKWFIATAIVIFLLAMVLIWWMYSQHLKKYAAKYGKVAIKKVKQDRKKIVDNIDDLEINQEDKLAVSSVVDQQAAIKNKAPQSTDVKNVAVPDNIFRAYDIRGIAHEQLSEELAFAIGKAVASEAFEKGDNSIIVARDARSHSQEFAGHAISGIISTGCDVVDIGLAPTPLMNFAATHHDKTSSGIIVTASHNPKEFNGFKMVVKGQTLVEADIQRLKERIVNNQYHVPSDGEKGKISYENMQQAYIDTILEDIAVIGDAHIVIDAANGAASELAPQMFEELGYRVTPLFCEFDGEFPNHDPDPSVEANLQALVNKVKAEQADTYYMAGSIVNDVC